MNERLVWGAPNRGPDGKPIVESNCRACVHWQLSGWIVREQTYGESCALNYNSFPSATECLSYAREPGSDDE